MYSLVPPFLEAKFCGVPSSVFDNTGCAAGEKLSEHCSIRYTEYVAMYERGS
jgi:hypothetical protein